MFANRQQAGKLLAGRLKQELSEGQATVVIALPRGGVPVAAEIAIALNCPIDVLVSKKMRSPDNPELAIGAVSSAGTVVLDDELRSYWGDRRRVIAAQQQEKERLVAETRELEEHWVAQAGISSRPEIRGKRVILVDDGIATGMTTLAALRSLRQGAPEQLILATPVVPSDTYCKLLKECDLLIALLVADEFSAVGFFYLDFHQVEDDEVIAELRRANR